MDELVHLTRAAGVATITLDSEHNRNALSRQLVSELTDRLTEAEGDPDVRVVLLRSAGRVFCSGADLSEAAAATSPDAALTIVDLQRRVAALPKPVVVRLAGPVRAGGLGIVGAADLVVAARSVTFALTEVRLALAPAVISLTLLDRLPSRSAADLFLTGRTFGADEAVSLGLVTTAVGDDELDAAVDALLGELALGRPQGFAATKALLNRRLLEQIDAEGDEVAALSARLFGSDEAREAMLELLASRRS